jgi:curved DNA-binding protein CbpA
MEHQQTYYDVLELDRGASELEIKKSYRRLALQYHPDRNHSPTAKEKFQLIGIAYETLSDPQSRKEYDNVLQFSGGGGKSSGGAGARHDNHYYGGGVQTTRPSTSHVFVQNHHHHRRHQFVDPLDQFNDLFSNDPFFQEAFRDMDDEFARRFQKPATTTASTDKGLFSARQAKSPAAPPPPPPPRKQGWLPWIMDCLGVDFTMTTHVVGSDGAVTASNYQSRPSKSGGGYTDKRTKTYIDDRGRQVCVKSMEKDGNRIDDKYINGSLVERRVNGVVETLEKIVHA